MTAPQYGRQPYSAPGEGIAITTQYSPVWTTLLAATKPKISFNGHEISVAGWGRTVFPFAPGQYHVHVYSPYFFPRRWGPADHTAVVNPGQIVELEYKAPVFALFRGSLGPPPQRYKGVVALAAVLAVPVLVIAILLIAGA
jgi:hypothetical protein